MNFFHNFHISHYEVFGCQTVFLRATLILFLFSDVLLDSGKQHVTSWWFLCALFPASMSHSRLATAD